MSAGKPPKKNAEPKPAPKKQKAAEPKSPPKKQKKNSTY